MPLVTITVRQGLTIHEKTALHQAVHAALIEAFKIPGTDCNQRMLELAPEDFIIPEGKSVRFTIIEMTVFPGRSPEAKKTLYRILVEKLKALNIPENDSMFILHEPPLLNWGIRGGQPANEVNLGFKIDL